MDIIKMREMLDVQGADGNWNYNEYMLGMYNGMEFMLSMAEGREPVYKSRPEKWLCDIEQIYSEPVAAETAS